MSTNPNPNLFRTLLLPTIIASVLFIPWLGEALFYSKGEPREAIVAVSILDSGNWILPTSYGVDIPYKPPFMAWLIAIGALVFNGGVVTEFLSRLPSAVAAVSLLVATWRLVYTRYGRSRAWLTMIVLATMFEFLRAASACRVDMILTACMVGGIYALYTMEHNKLRVLWAILLFSGATLTKGPIGTLLPCLATGLYFLFIRRNFFKTLVFLTSIAVTSFIVPALWYWLAWRQGGDNFLDLAWEENIGRLTGTMSYDSHINPWYYNVTSILAGALPWTIPVVVGMFSHHVRKIFSKLSKIKELPLLSITVFLTVFIFYCIPSSKRSVYLLPCYPFLAFGMTFILEAVRASRRMRYWARILAVIAILAPLSVIFLQFISIPKAQLEPMSFIDWFIIIIPLAGGSWWLFTRSKSADGLAGSVALTFIIMLAYNAVFMPMTVNPRSDKTIARQIEQIVPGNDIILSSIPEDSLLRYYSINYYLHDRLRRVETTDTTNLKYWLITSEPTDTSSATLISQKSTDTRRPVYLVRHSTTSVPF